MENKNSCMTFLLIISSLTVSSGICFHGNCGFTCHCADERLCRDDVTCDCDEGSAEVPWSGSGCQIGNVAFGKEAEITNPRTSFNGTNVAENCNDGSLVLEKFKDTCCGFKNETGSSWILKLGRTFVIKNVLVYGSTDRFYSIKKLGIYRKSQGRNDVCGITETTNEHPKNISCSNKLATEIQLNKTVMQLLDMCEVVVIGYEYKECEALDGEYYYGPGCLSKCNCPEQCDFITGECSTCKTGYHQYNEGKCSECTPGRWGEQCNHKCNCKDEDEICDHLTGECKLSGCKPWYAHVGCDYRLARLRNAQIEVELSGTEVNINITASVEYRSKENIVYQRRYRKDNNWTNSSTTSLIPTNDTVSFNTRLPGGGKFNYTLCIVPYDTHVQMDGESACVSVFTDCQDYIYGDQCQYKYTCININEGCSKVDGKCKNCEDHVVRDACTITSPTYDDVILSHVSGKSHSIDVGIQVYHNYSEMYSIIEMSIEATTDITFLKSVNITVNDDERSTRIIKDPESPYQISATSLQKDPVFIKSIKHVIAKQELQSSSTSVCITLTAVLACVLCASLIVNMLK